MLAAVAVVVDEAMRVIPAIPATLVMRQAIPAIPEMQAGQETPDLRGTLLA